MTEEEINKVEDLTTRVIEYLRYKERKYLERDVLNDNDLISGTMILDEMIKKGDITLSKAMQIFPAIKNPYNEYTVKHTERNK